MEPDSLSFLTLIDKVQNHSVEVLRGLSGLGGLCFQDTCKIAYYEYCSLTLKLSLVNISCLSLFDYNYNVAYIAFMWFFASVPSHMYNQHVLGFEGFPFSCTALPVTGKVLAILLDVIIVDMSNKLILCFTLITALFPVTNEVLFFLLRGVIICLIV